MVNSVHHLIDGIVLYKNKTFKLTEITKIFHVNRHFIIHLVEVGIIKPVVDRRGRGKSRSYSYINLIEIGIFIYLKKLDISYDRARKLLLTLRDYLIEHVDMLSYVSEIGYLSGGEPMGYIDLDFQADKLTPEDFLKKAITAEMRTPTDKGIKKSDFAYYFILDVRNIIAYIDSEISKL